MSEAYTTVERWAAHFNAGDSEAVAHLYTPDAVLWGTLSQAITATADSMLTYFIAAAKLGLTVSLGDFRIQSPASDIAVISGHYDLYRTLSGRARCFPARYSFVLVRQRREWLIAQHHSSLKPAAGVSFTQGIAQ
ncbi:MAG: SgcJ/EcaC family oxidoreductase [Bradyrhizobiaceae bacterium]|nr:MAG: SgcJ/EcaC family oxidoreductase [Bradyrhizobiaceae bacterium]